MILETLATIMIFLPGFIVLMYFQKTEKEDDEKFYESISNIMIKCYKYEEESIKKKTEHYIR